MIVPLADEQVTSAFDMGFAFPFFGQTTTLFWIADNGFVTLFEQTGPGCCQGQPIPTPGDPDGIMAAWWTDLDPTAANITFARTQVDLNDTLIVEYEDTELVETGEDLTFQVVIYEN
ncbi:MAG: hypothetical protein R3185_04490, partial [Candidatus Thermoplasmatota archaeon]|nr:hypothetical protein [Candidatus Thermoplasmatota archaeon]